MDNDARSSRPVVFITGASRPNSIGAAIARNLASLGWDVAFGFWDDYDAAMPWGASENGHVAFADELRAFAALLQSELYAKTLHIEKLKAQLARMLSACCAAEPGSAL